MQFALYVVNNLRQLRLHSLGVVNTKRLPVSATGAVELPCDYIDWAKIGLEFGQFVRPLVARDSINRLTSNNTTTGARQLYGNSGGVDGLSSGDDVNINTNGEGIGRLFGIRQGEQGDTFKVIKERNEIQLHESLVGLVSELYVEYLSSGEGDEEDTASQIDYRASEALELAAVSEWLLQKKDNSYQIWNTKANNAVRILRAQISDLTEDDIIRIVRDGYSSTIKN
jgi:hypothetical protein